MFDPREDPLALGLKQRAREQRMAGWAQNPSLAALEPALGEDWDAWFQAADEATGGKGFALAGGAAPEHLTEAPGEGASLQDMENWRTMQSNQLRGKPVNPLIGPESHGKNLLRRMRPSVSAMQKLG